MTHIFILTPKKKKKEIERKMEKNKKNKNKEPEFQSHNTLAHSPYVRQVCRLVPSLRYEILISYLREGTSLPGLKMAACPVPEKTVTRIYPEKTERMTTNKGKKKSNELIYQSLDTTTHCPYVYRFSNS